MRSLREFWKISYPLYLNMYFTGQVRFNRNVNKNINKIIKSIKLNNLFMKIIISCFLIFGIILDGKSIVSTSGFFLVVIFLFTFFFLNTLSVFVSDSLDILKILPLSNEEISLIKIMTLFRVFDVPLVTLTIAYPIIMYYYHGFYALVPSFLSIVSIEILSIYISLKFAKLFYKKIAYSSDSIFSTILRVITYFIWALAFMGLYMMVSIFEIISKLKINLIALDFIFPINYAVISSGIADLKAVVSSIAFFALSIVAFKKCKIELLKSTEFKVQTSTKLNIKMSKPIIAFIKKDFKIITRDPGMVILFFMPIIEAIFLSIVIIPKTIITKLILILSVTGFLPILTITFSGIENRVLLKILPIENKTIRIAKTILGCIVYFATIPFVVFRTILYIALFPAVFTMNSVCTYLAEVMNVTNNMQANTLKAITIIVVCYILLYLPLLFGILAYLLKIFNVFVVVLVAGLIESIVGIIFIKI